MSRSTACRPAATFSRADVRRYYDRNTSWFLRLGRSRDVGAIHRAVWGSGVTTRAEAFQFVDACIAQALAAPAAAAAPARALHVVDLGCGVGATLCFLAGRLKMRGTGVTLSVRQARLATARIAAAGLSARLRCLEADFCALPLATASADAAYAIESFVHAPSPDRFFAEAARVLTTGGLLMVCDDVRRGGDDPRAARALARFAQGWHLNALLTTAEVTATAERHGFRQVNVRDLTPLLAPAGAHERWLDRLARMAGALPFRSARLSSVVGSSALRTCLDRGWIGYELMTFARNAH